MNRLFFIVAIVALVVFLFAKFPYVAAQEDTKMSALYYIILLTGIGAFSARSIPLNQTIKYGAGWLAAFALLILAYSYKDEFFSNRIMAELFPNQARLDSEGNLVIRASKDGHFYIEAKVNGVAVNFMIDTGASDVVLNKSDAKRVGIDADSLNYNKIYNTANGTTTGATIKLNRLQINKFVLDDFPASVNSGKLDNSLLGMTAVRKLGGFSIDGDKMVIGTSDGEDNIKTNNEDNSI